MKQFSVSVFNELGCLIGGDVVKAENETDAIETYAAMTQYSPLSGDRITAEEYDD